MTKENNCAAVPLLEQMRRIPKDWREMREVGPCAHQNVPYGRMLHEAAAEIERHQQLRLEGSAYIAGLQQEIERLQDRLRIARNIIVDAQNFIHPTTIWRDTDLMQRNIDRFLADGRTSEPSEGYSQEYADQMRTALLRIAAPVYLNLKPAYADPDNVKAICDGLNERIKIAQDALLGLGKKSGDGQ